MDKRAYWLWLTAVFGAASQRLWQLGDKYDTAEEFAYALRSNECGRLSDAEIKRIKGSSFEQAEYILEMCEKDNISVYCYKSEGGLSAAAEKNSRSAGSAVLQRKP